MFTTPAPRVLPLRPPLSCAWPSAGFLAVPGGLASQSPASKQNSTVSHGNTTAVSGNMKDNPRMQFYASIYALSMVVMLILKAVRGVVFVKVCSGGPCSRSPSWPGRLPTASPRLIMRRERL